MPPAPRPEPRHHHDRPPDDHRDPAALFHQDGCRCPDCGNLLHWLPGSSRHMCWADGCYWLQAPRRIETIRTTLLPPFEP